VSENASYDSLGCSFLDEQFRRAIKDGVIATLDEDLKKSVLAAYRVIGRANEKDSWSHGKFRSRKHRPKE
jgi:hypothetical protein